MGGRGGSSSRSITVGGITFTRDRLSAAEKRSLVKVDLTKLDRAWKKDSNGYLPSSGSNDIGDRRRGVRDFLRSNNTIHAPRVYLRKDGSIAFEDGRHRTAFLRDSGHQYIVVAVKAGQRSRFKSKFE